MAKGKKTSLAVRAAALLIALALAALAARLWLGGAPGGGGRAAAAQPAEPAAAPIAPPLHEPHSAKDQQALRDILRGAEQTKP